MRDTKRGQGLVDFWSVAYHMHACACRIINFKPFVAHVHTLMPKTQHDCFCATDVCGSCNLMLLLLVLQRCLLALSAGSIDDIQVVTLSAGQGTVVMVPHINSVSKRL